MIGLTAIQVIHVGLHGAHEFYFQNKKDTDTGCEIISAIDFSDLIDSFSVL